jgi:Tfp pilus assembly protein PilF
LELYEQALPITREVGDKSGEATTLHNMGTIFIKIGQPTKALELYEQALPITREVGDKSGEVTTLNNM